MHMSAVFTNLAPLFPTLCDGTKERIIRSVYVPWCKQFSCLMQALRVSVCVYGLNVSVGFGLVVLSKREFKLVIVCIGLRICYALF